MIIRRRWSGNKERPAWVCEFTPQEYTVVMCSLAREAQRLRLFRNSTPNDEEKWLRMTELMVSMRHAEIHPVYLQNEVIT